MHNATQPLAPAGAVNDPPEVPKQVYYMDNNQPFDAPAADGLLRGAVDVDGDPMEAVASTSPTQGTLVLQKDGAFTYTLNEPRYSGTDSFQFTVTDGHGGTTTSTAEINVVDVGMQGSGLAKAET